MVHYLECTVFVTNAGVVIWRARFSC